MAAFRVTVPALGLVAALVSQTGCAFWKPAVATESPLIPPLTAKGSDNKALPSDQAVQASLAVAQNCDKSGNDQGALEQYERVLQLDPRNQKAARRLAVLYDRRCDYAKADAEYAKLAKARPRDADLFNDWGYSFYQRTKWQDAEKHLRKALEIDSTHARARCNLGLVLGHQGRYPDAFQAFRAVVSEAEAHCNLAFVYWSQGKLDEARRECQLASQLDGTCGKAREILALLDRPANPAPANAVASGSRRPERTDRRRAEFQAEAQAAVAVRTNSVIVPVADSAAAAQPVYRSPNGLAWVPVSAAKPAVTPVGPAGEATGTISWE